LGFDRNEYPGDAGIKELRKEFAFAGYWLTPAPGEKTNSWAGKRRAMEGLGYGFLLLARLLSTILYGVTPRDPLTIVAGVTVLLEHAVTPRTAGETISGTAVDGAGGGTSGPANHADTGSQVGMASQGNPINSAGGPASPVPGASPSRKPPTRQQLMAVAEAEAEVQQNPRSVTAHLALASAYVAAGASQLAAVEWLAVTQLNPGNAEASTDLALLAFEVGRARQARTMVDRALATNPRYPEGLYVRGLIDLMGLRQPAAAVRDLNAYLAAAPYGSHRTDAVTLIALAQAQGHP
jgi:hypothetical protein